MATTTTRRLLAAALLGAALTASAAPATATEADPSQGVRVSVEIEDRTAPDVARLVVVADGPLVAGDEIVVRGSHLEPGTSYTVNLHSDPVLLGTATADGDGDVALTATIPEETEPGEHHVSATASATGQVVESDPFSVVAAPAGAGLATTGAGLTGLVVLAGAAIGTGAALRRRVAGRTEA